jgi:hypothetical protein
MVAHGSITEATQVDVVPEVDELSDADGHETFDD